MKRLPDLPQLAIVPTDALQPHEHTDPQRATPLVAALEADGVLKNPPVVLPLGGERLRYVVLDGENRALAFQALSLPHALVQVVHAADDSVDIKTWNHVVLCPDTDEFMACLRGVGGLTIVEAERGAEPKPIDSAGSHALAAVSHGPMYERRGPDETLANRLETLNSVVKVYDGRWNFERTNSHLPEELDQLYDQRGCLIVFPSFSVQDVVTAAAQGLYFPTGITRFIISPRALRVNFPIERLKGEAPLRQKQAELDAWVKQRMRQRQVRFYAESTYLFDE
jgi:ParB/Sulfiredoxin domain